MHGSCCRCRHALASPDPLCRPRARALPQGERRIRGTALYAQASLINNECLPNVARFDRFDAPPPAGAPPGANAAAEFRALHDIPPGARLVARGWRGCGRGVVGASLPDAAGLRGTVKACIALAAACSSGFVTPP